MLASLAFAAALAAEPSWADPVPELSVSYYRSLATAGAQCRYADGRKAMLFLTKTPSQVVFVLRMRDGWNTVVPIEIIGPHKWSYETNGGVATYVSFEVATKHLLAQPHEALTANTFEAFVKRKRVPACARRTFDVDLGETQYRDPDAGKP